MCCTFSGTSGCDQMVDISVDNRGSAQPRQPRMGETWTVRCCLRCVVIKGSPETESQLENWSRGLSACPTFLFFWLDTIPCDFTFLLGLDLHKNLQTMPCISSIGFLSCPLIFSLRAHSERAAFRVLLPNGFGFNADLELVVLPRAAWCMASWLLPFLLVLLSLSPAFSLPSSLSSISLLYSSLPSSFLPSFLFLLLLALSAQSRCWSCKTAHLPLSHPGTSCFVQNHIYLYRDCPQTSLVGWPEIVVIHWWRSGSRPT